MASRTPDTNLGPERAARRCVAGRDHVVGRQMRLGALSALVACVALAGSAPPSLGAGRRTGHRAVARVAVSKASARFRTLAWHDEFTGLAGVAPDPLTWGPVAGDWSGGDGEREYY